MVREGFYEKYFIDPFIRHYADFKTGMSRRDATSSLLAWLVVTAGVFGLLTGLVGLLGADVAFPCLWVIGGLWIAGSTVPLCGLAARSARGSASNEENPEKFRMLPVDVMLTVIFILFLILGIPMMTTTLRSENIYIDPNGKNYKSPTALPVDSVVEEAIFNYQQYDIADQEEAPDTLGSLSDLDTIIGREPAEPEPEPEHPDSLAF